MFNEGKSVEAILKEFDIIKGTLFEHFYKFLIDGNKLEGSERLMPFLKIEKSKLDDIFKEYDAIGCMSLKPVFDRFGGEVDYEDLKLARVIYLGRQTELIKGVS
jgi:hypothetical protein